MPDCSYLLVPLCCDVLGVPLEADAHFPRPLGWDDVVRQSCPWSEAVHATSDEVTLRLEDRSP